MKTIITRIGTAGIVLLCFVNLSAADSCKDANEMIDWALAKAPEGMTEEFIQTALGQCPGNPELYHRIARYYRHWYETELNPEKQATFRARAMEYYREGIKLSKGKKSESMQSELSTLQKSPEFSKAAFRALRPAPAGSTGSGLKIKVNFEFDSYQLTEGAQDYLDQLGEDLAEHQSVQISVEGHTDRYGTEAYNSELSIKRAESVKTYLVEKFEIAPNRIVTLGHGFERLANVTDPYSPENRRVEVIKTFE